MGPSFIFSQLLATQALPLLKVDMQGGERALLALQHAALVRGHRAFARAVAFQVAASAQKKHTELNNKTTSNSESSRTSRERGADGLVEDDVSWISQRAPRKPQKKRRKSRRENKELERNVHNFSRADVRLLRRSVYASVRSTTLIEWDEIAHTKREREHPPAGEALRRAQVSAAGPCAVLAAFRVLRSSEFGVRESDALDVLGGDVAEMCLPERFLGLYGSGMLLDVSRCVVRDGHPLRAIERATNSCLRLRGSEDWRASVETDPLFDASVLVTVRRCGFAEFFERHRAPQLTGLFCAAEMATGRQIAKYAGERVRVEKVRTIADGFPRCEIRFRSRITDKEEDTLREG
jgi:L-2-amino-thiazoline-4-carboxylic acid hydrolase